MTTSNEPTKRALIIGGGIGGPTLALALAKVGIDSTVFERRRTAQLERGSWLTFQANGMDALRSIDAHGPLVNYGYPVDRIGFINGSGKSLGGMPLTAPRADGLTSRMMPRAQIYSKLAALAAEQGVQTKFGKEFVTARTHEDGSVTAVFADGSEEHGDFLVGADGIHSRVRALIDPSAPPARYVPVLNIGGYIPNFSVRAAEGEFCMQFGTRCFFAWMNTPDGGTVWFANPPRKAEPSAAELAAVTDEQWRTELHSLMDGDAGESARVIDAAVEPLTGWATYDMPTMKRWHNGSMVLIGDAAHATAPSAGQGASMTLEDAVILAQCLRDAASVSVAFELFEKLRRTRVEKIVKLGHRGSNNKAAGPVGRVIRDALLPLIFKRAAKDAGKSTAWIQGHHIDFDAMVC